MFNHEQPLSLDHWMANVQGAAFVYSFYSAGAAGAAANAQAKAMTVPKGSLLGEQPVIIGETMKRVEMEAAKHPNAIILNNMPDFTIQGLQDYQITSKMMQYNRTWLYGHLKNGSTIIDIGIDINRSTPSIFYQMESNMIKNFNILYP